MTPVALERELRVRLTVAEYRLLQARLTGAVKAIATLQDRAPDLLPHMFGGIERARALSPRTQGALASLVDALIAAADTKHARHIDRRELLRVVQRSATANGREREEMI